MTDQHREFPFAALVGQEQLKSALLVNAIDPTIGGVLIRGEKGTAKSTAARALAALLPLQRRMVGCPYNCDPDERWVDCPHCGALTSVVGAKSAVPFVDLPLGATEDRVLGTLDFERALREGRRAVHPGLLAGAHRGVLYIDEVNLLSDHLVDVLLDAAARGVNTVQREGVALTHPARFLLIGTMNPEEGDLRPQLLDRFGLMVTVTSPRQPEPRAEVVRRRLAFEADRAGFAARWAEEQATCQNSIVSARSRYPEVVVEEGILNFICQLCCELEVDSLRADIVLHKTARALAALHGRAAVTVDEVRTAAELVLPHRQRRRPFEQPGLDGGRLDDLLAAFPPATVEPGSEASQRPSDQIPDSAHDADNGTDPFREKSGTSPFPKSPAETQVFQPGPTPETRRIKMAAEGEQPRASFGRRNSAATTRQGHYVRAVPDERPQDLAIDATIRAAACRGGHTGDGIQIERTDLHCKERIGSTGTLILFLVDASGSMAARRRMEAVKGAVLGILKDAYEQRDQVGVLAFRGPRAELLLAPTSSVELADQALRALPTGGRTPLAHGLVLAHETVARVRRSDPERLILLVLLSDGKANVPLPGTEGEPWQQVLQAAEALASAGLACLVLDTDAGFIRTGRAEHLAKALAAECLPLEELSAGALLLKVRQHCRK